MDTGISNNQKKNTNSRRYYEMWGFFVWVVLVGFIGIICISSYNSCFGETQNSFTFFSFIWIVGILLAISAASFMSGGLVGFLFGVPKVLGTEKARVSLNNNLVQVSDWVTKILLGVGLTQLYKLPFKLQSLGEYIAKVVNVPGINSINTVALLLYFSVCGFAVAYIWASIYYPGMLDDTSKELEEMKDENKHLAEKVTKQNTELKTLSNEFSKYISDEVAINIENDPQKGKWGGKTEQNDRILTAKVTPTTYSSELFNVELTVSTTNVQKPITGNAIFHLHDTFKNPNRSVKFINSKATLNLVAWGAFTVGVELDAEKETTLEIDLATDVIDAPKLFIGR